MPDFTPATLHVPERTRLLTALVGPRPIAFVSTLDGKGGGNLAPFSFFMAGGYAPLSVAFAPVRWRDGEPKDTLRNVEATGEFTISLATPAMLERLNQASHRYPAEVDEFDAAGFARAPAAVVRPPRVAESPAALECRLHTVVRHGDGPGAGAYVIGEVVHVHADDAICLDGWPDSSRIEYLARLGGEWWSAVRPGQLFRHARPTAG